jgi:S-adenosyl-L-methionine hydrolase (adenosine-forming)
MAAPPPPIVTLTTDFGTADGYVGAMKGVLARLAPAAVVVDLAHDVPRHDVAHAAWVIATCAWEFPIGTIHVVVVDPGVGGARLELVVETRGHRFVGPDNGVLAYVAGAGDKDKNKDKVEVHAITSTAFRLPDVSPTFHGRDVFAPAAAALANGLPAAAAGPATCAAGSLPWAPHAIGTRGVVVHVDTYGNLITNLRPTPGATNVVLAINGRIVAVRRTYDDVSEGALVAYVGSAGTYEVAVRGGSAARVIEAGRGSVVEAK